MISLWILCGKIRVLKNTIFLLCSIAKFYDSALAVKFWLIKSILIKGSPPERQCANIWHIYIYIYIKKSIKFHWVYLKYFWVKTQKSEFIRFAENKQTRLLFIWYATIYASVYKSEAFICRSSSTIWLFYVETLKESIIHWQLINY